MKRHPDETVTYGLFQSTEEMVRAFEALLAAGISIDDISLLMSEETHDRHFTRLMKHKTTEGAAAGGLLGGAFGGILGGLISLGAGTALGALGLMVMGPAIAFAAAGGLVGGFLGHEVPEHETARLLRELQAGHAVIAVHTPDGDEIDAARRILERVHAQPVEARA